MSPLEEGGVAAVDGMGSVLVRNTAFNVAGRTIGIVGWMFVAPLVLSRLGAQHYGFWSLLSMLTGLTLTMDFGFSAALTKYVAEYSGADNTRALRGVFTLSILAALALGLVWAVGVTFLRNPILDFARVGADFRQEAGDALLLSGVFFAGNLLALALSAAITGAHRLDLVNRNTAVATLVQLGGTGISLALHAGIPGLVIAGCVSVALNLVLSWTTLRRVLPAIGLDFQAPTRDQLGTISRFGAALQVINLGVLAQYQLPKLFLTRLVSLAAVGSFDLGYRVVLSAWSLPAMLLTPLLPAVAHLDADGQRERIRRLYRRVSRYLLAIATGLGAGLVALAGPFFTAWLGAGHAEAARAGQALGLLLTINMLTSTGCLVARGLGWPWIEARYLMLSFAVQLVLGLWLVPRLGFDGALVAMLASGIAGTAYFLVAFLRAFREPLAAHLGSVVLRPFAAGILAGLAGWMACGATRSDPATWTRPHALVALMLGGGALVATHALGLFASRYLGVAEMREIVNMLLRRTPSIAGAV